MIFIIYVVCSFSIYAEFSFINQQIIKLKYSVRIIKNPLTFINSFFFVVEIISKKNSIIKEWREFEERCTYEYAHNEVKALKAKSAK